MKHYTQISLTHLQTNAIQFKHFENKELEQRLYFPWNEVTKIATTKLPKKIKSDKLN